MTNTTLPLLTAGGAIQLDDIFATRQGNDTVDKSITGQQIIDFVDAHVTVNAADLQGDTLPSNILHSDLTSVGVIGDGTWQGTPIDDAYIASADNWNGKISDIVGLLVDGTNTTVTGSGTALDPYQVNVASSGATVNSVTATDNSLTASPTSGDVVIALNTAHANTWTGQQTFNTAAPIVGTATADTAAIFNGTNQLVSSGVTSTELGYVGGVTGAIQTQIDSKVPATRTVNGHALSADVTVTKSDIGLGNVENTALSTWGGSANIVTIGNVTSGSLTNVQITGLNSPVNASDAVNKAYVDNIAAGLSQKQSCRVGTTAALTGTYSNGASGVGATFTFTATGVNTIDGVTLALNDRVLVKNQASTFQNGIYFVSTAGAIGVNGVLTRTTDYDTPSEVSEGSYTIIAEGTAQFGTLWMESGSGPFTIGTTPITFTELQVAPQTVTFTGNVTGTGAGTIALTIGAAQVTNAMLAGSIDLTTKVTGILPAANGGAGAVNGILKANGAGTVSAAVAGTDYVAPSTTVNGHALSSNVTVSASDLTTGTLAAARGGAGTVSGIMKANGSGTVSAATAGTDYVTPTGSETLTNKRVNPRVSSTISSSTPTPNADTDDMYLLTALAAGATFGAPIGTPVAGQALIIRIKDNGSAQTLAYNAIYRAIGVTLPTTTVSGKTLYLGMLYNAVDTKWDVTGVAQEA